MHGVWIERRTERTSRARAHTLIGQLVNNKMAAPCRMVISHWVLQLYDQILALCKEIKQIRYDEMLDYITGISNRNIVE